MRYIFLAAVLRGSLIPRAGLLRMALSITAKSRIWASTACACRTSEADLSSDETQACTSDGLMLDICGSPIVVSRGFAI